MRVDRLIVVLCLVAMPGCVYTPAPNPPRTVGAAPVLMPSRQVTWAPAKFPSGARIAVLSGNPETGPFRALERWPAGTRVALHTHTHDSYAFAHAGTMVLRFEGQSPVELGPGSWAMIPGGVPHETTCRGGADDCVFYIEMSGRADTIITEPR